MKKIKKITNRMIKINLEIPKKLRIFLEGNLDLKNFNNKSEGVKLKLIVGNSKEINHIFGE